MFVSEILLYNYDYYEQALLMNLKLISSSLFIVFKTSVVKSNIIIRPTIIFDTIKKHKKL